MKMFNKEGYVATKTFDQIANIKGKGKRDALEIIADLIRYNTLLSVARAGTGHLGASLSIIEVLTEVYFNSFSFSSDEDEKNDSFILSKGHAAPSLYATLSAKGYLPISTLDKLRRLQGLPGHCDIRIPGVEANTGSLAMGLSKAVGEAILRKRKGIDGSVITIVGDGELQEGQCWEALMSASSYKTDNLYIVVDDNKVQTDQYVEDVLFYNDLKLTFKSFGFACLKASAMTTGSVSKAFQKLQKITGKPKVFIAQTQKGQGVSFMEHGNVLSKNSDRYVWHNRAPNMSEFKKAIHQISERVEQKIIELGLKWEGFPSPQAFPIKKTQSDVKGDNLLQAFSEALVREAKKNKKIIVLDADLEEDCGFSKFRHKFPKRFFEMGIMEQHLASTASSVSRMGFWPVLSSYASFITSRANEQLYNMFSEDAKALVVGNMAGILPATPGKSHTGFRDIACMKNIPNIWMYQPITSQDLSNILKRYFNKKFENKLYLRLSMASSRVKLSSPAIDLEYGKPHIIKKGRDLLVVGIGPVILGEMVKASEELETEGVLLEIWNIPWIIDFDKSSFKKAAKSKRHLLIIEDHFKKGGFGESLMAFLTKEKIHFQSVNHLALNNYPKTGFRDEILQYYGLHYRAIQKFITAKILK